MSNPETADKPAEKSSTKPAGDVVVIKKYPNRRLYNTETSVYVTLDDLADLVKAGRDFIVQDARSGEDLTRQVLTQIIFEQETRGTPMLPTNFLRSIISLYDGSMGGPLQHYLDASMQAFMGNQEKIRALTSKAMQEFSPMQQFEEMTRQNMAFFERAFSNMMNPFSAFGPDEKKKK